MVGTRLQIDDVTGGVTGRRRSTGRPRANIDSSNESRKTELIGILIWETMKRNKRKWRQFYDQAMDI